jgi:signal transduction histidine kinase
LGVLLLQPPARWPLWLTGALIGHVVFGALTMRGGFNFPHGLISGALGTVAAPIAAGVVIVLLRNRAPEERPLVTLGSVALAALTAPLLPGFISAEAAAWLGSTTPFALVWRTWWAGDALGIAALTPMVLAWGTGTSLKWVDSRWRMAEIGLAIGGLMVTTYLVCGRPLGLGDTLLFIAPFFIWLGLRSDAQVISAAGLASLGIAIHQTLMGTGPFIGGPLSDQFSALGVHALYGSLIPAGLVMAYLTEHRRTLQVRFELAQVLLELFTYLVDASPAELRQRIQQALEVVGNFTSAHRARLLLFRDSTIEVFATWVRPGAADKTELLDGQSMGRFPWAIGELAAGRELRFDSRTQGEQISGSERALYAALNARALQIMPLLQNGELRGAMALAWAGGKPDVDPERMTLLPIATRLFASGLRRARAQEQLGAYQDSLRSLASELSLAEERVRRATAVDLHDSIAQSLTVARIKLGQLLQQDPNHTLMQLREILDEAIGHTRTLIADLSPPMLYELGLVQAIRWLADREQRRGDFTCEVVEVGEPGEPSEACKVAAFQCFRELLVNVVKHAHAAAVRVCLSWHDGRLEINIEDDGIGFTEDEQITPTPATGHFGLFDDWSVVGEASDGREAVEQARAVKPDVVVIDVAMPELNGIDATRKLVNLPEHPKVVALSMHSDRNFVAGMLRAGASTYLRKESAFDEIARAIETVLKDQAFLGDGITGVVVELPS